MWLPQGFLLPGLASNEVKQVLADWACKQDTAPMPPERSVLLQLEQPVNAQASSAGLMPICMTSDMTQLCVKNAYRKLSHSLASKRVGEGCHLRSCIDEAEGRSGNVRTMSRT